MTSEPPGTYHRTVRARAEALLRERSAAASLATPHRTEPEALHELHELQVHQIELEMQNDELRRAQDDIALISARYVDLYDQAPAGYCTLAQNGVICEANLTLAALLGIDRNALLGKPLTQFVVPDDQDVLYHHRRRLRETRGPLACELRMLAADGAPAAVELTTVVTVTVDASPVLRIMVADVRARVRARELLQDSERLSVAVLDSVTARIAVIGADSRIIAVNEAWRSGARRRGAPPTIVTGIGIDYLTDWLEAGGCPCREDAAAIRAGIRRVLGAEALNFEFEYLCSEGEAEHWYRVNVTPMPGHRPGAVVSDIDISAIRSAERERRVAAERIQLISRASRDIIWDWDVSNGALWISGNLEDTPLLAREKTFDGLMRHVDDSDRERVIAGIGAAIAGTTLTWSDSFRLMRSDTGVPVVARGDVIRSEGGVAVRMVAAMTDVSARLQLEERLRQLQRLEAVGQLTGGIAHDFNNLLTVILGNTDLLLESVAGDESRSSLAQQVLGAAQRGAELTQRLLAFSRQQPLNPRAVDVNQLTLDLGPLLRRVLGAHIEVSIRHRAAPLSVLVDPGQLENALLNLCLNSRDALPDGGLLAIETDRFVCDAAYQYRHPGSIAGVYVTLQVTDSGVGIAPEHLPLVFEPFFTTKASGTGLGLAMVYGFIKQSHGHVTVESTPGAGTTVRMLLPPASSVARHDEPADAASIPSEGGETILLVEDDAMVRSYVLNLLTRARYTVLTADSGPAGLLILQSRTDVDLLLTDVVMPGGMNGRALADEARAIQPGLRVLYMSGYSADALMDEGRLAPGVNLLNKPYRRQELLAKIRSVLQAARTQ